MTDERTVTTSEPPDVVPPSLLLVLAAASGPMRTESLPKRGLVSIGRSGDCAIVVDDGSLSRRHATIRLPEMAIVDHDSRNGTWIGETRVTAETTLAIGQPFRLGKVTAVIVRVGAVGRDVLPAGTIAAVHALADRVAPSMVNVLVQGETGVGKELLAERIHRSSPRADKPLVKVNCAAFTPSLFESQMFGHERGAFTGAIDAQLGTFEAADGGTLFLDEVAELGLDLQAKLLRVVEDRVVTRVGAVQGRHIDVRFIAASNKPLANCVDDGSFRADLYFRLAGVTIEIPPLRERGDEIRALAEMFVARTPDAPALSSAAVDRLRGYGWPGNIRQLRNVIERAIVMCDGASIEPEHVVFDEPTARAAQPLPAKLDPDNAEHVAAALTACAGNQTRAARMLGISRNTLLARLDHHGLPRPRKSR
jgi:DNA-binding NtrC family response regulator